MALNQQARVSPPAHAFWQSYQGLSLRDPFFTGRVAFRQALTGLVSSLRVANNTLLQWNVAQVPRGKARRDAYGGPDGQVISKETKAPDLLLAGDAGLPLPGVPPLPPGLGRNPLQQGRHRPPRLARPGAEGAHQVLLDAAQSFAAEFNLNYSRWQGVKSTAVNEALNGKLGVRGSLRQATEEINKVLVEAYSPGMTGPTAPGAQGGRPGAGRPSPHLLRAGFGKVDVTPPLEVPYLSYYPRQTPFQGVHDRLYARALAVEGRRAMAGAVVALDSPVSAGGCWARGGLHRHRARRGGQRTGIPGRTSCWPPATPTPHPRARTSPIWRRSSPAPAPGWRCWRGRSRRPWPRPGRARPAVLRGPPGSAPAWPGTGASSPATGAWCASAARPGRPGAEGAPRRPRPAAPRLGRHFPSGDPGHWRGP